MTDQAAMYFGLLVALCGVIYYLAIISDKLGRLIRLMEHSNRLAADRGSRTPSND